MPSGEESVESVWRRTVPAFTLSESLTERISDLENVKRIADIHRDAIMDLPGVMSFGIGGSPQARAARCERQKGFAFVIGVRLPRDAPTRPLTLDKVDVHVKVIGTPRRVAS
jgi:hypothetical protein